MGGSSISFSQLSDKHLFGTLLFDIMERRLVGGLMKRVVNDIGVWHAKKSLELQINANAIHGAYYPATPMEGCPLLQRSRALLC